MQIEQRGLPQKKSFKDRDSWRRWLEKNHESAEELWLILYKKHTGKPSIRLDEAVEEALCFGWIDGKLRRIDGEKHEVRFCPRRKGSVWSEINIDRVKRLAREGRMTKAGLDKFKDVEKDPRFKLFKRDFEIPQFVIDGLKANKKAWREFERLAPSYKKQYVWYIASAKREETRRKRVEDTIKRLLSRKHVWIARDSKETAEIR